MLNATIEGAFPTTSWKAVTAFISHGAAVPVNCGPISAPQRTCCCAAGALEPAPVAGARRLAPAFGALSGAERRTLELGAVTKVTVVPYELPRWFRATSRKP